jgi:macrolide-specific efflux system membrane fusion protein
MTSNDKIHLPERASRDPGRKRLRGKWLFLAIVLLAGGIYSGRFFYGNIKENKSAQIAIFEVKRGNIERTVSALGKLQPRDYVDVGAQVSGQLQKLYVDYGNTVTAGQLLAEIDPRVLLARVDSDRAQLASLQAQLIEREAQLDLAEQQYARQERLKRDNATSEDAFQISLASVKTTRAQITALKAQVDGTESTLKGDQATLGYTKIYAPMSGTVVQILAKQGQTLNANQTAPVILRIADLSTMTVWTQVSEADVTNLQIGMHAYFTILGKPARRWTGTLTQILPTPEIINNVVLFTALFDVANPEGELMSQMSAQVFFVVASAQNVPVVPLSALTPIDEQAGKYSVMVVGDGDVVTARTVQIGISNRLNAGIVSGLDEGDRIALDKDAGGDRTATQVKRQANPYKIF